MSAAAVATGVRRNSSSVATTTIGSGERVRRSSGVAPTSIGGGGSATAARMTSLAQAAALATAEALERKTRGGGGGGAGPAGAVSPPPSAKGVRPTRSNSNGSTRATATKGSAGNATNNRAPASSNKPKPRMNKQQPQQQREVVMTKTGTTTRSQAALATGDVHLIIGVLGLKFKCLVQREWPCEAMIATTVAEYHLAYPSCELPGFNAIYHTERKEFLKFSDSIGQRCADNDEIELGMTEKSVLASPTGGSAIAAGIAPSVASSSGSSRSEDRRETFDFMIMFHRLPLGFTLKQNNEHIVVANIYPHSTATHYERLETGVTVVRIADTLLENLGLRQVHDLIKNAKIPLEIQFRGYKKPSLRASLLMAAAKSPATTGAGSVAAPQIPPTRSRSVSSPKPEDDSVSPPPPSSSTGERARSTSAAASSSGKRTVELVMDATDARQQLSGKRSTGRSRRSSQESTNERELVAGDNQNNDSPHGPGRATVPRRVRQSSSNSAAVNGEEGLEDGDENHEPRDVQLCDEGSNQNEDDTEELLVDQIKTLQTALLKKHEEAKQIARQIELFHEKLASVRSKSSNGKAQQQQHQQDELETGEPSIAPPAARQLKRRPSSTSSLKLRLTPEVLEAMDSKAGVPPKTAAFYQSSNVSSVSGYSNYSSRSNAAPRSGLRTTSSMRRSDSNNMRSDASVTSHSSATSERRQSNPRSPRSQCVKNINNRYSYIPQKYSANASSSAEAPTSSSLSSRGAVMSRAKATRDSFIVKSESPGVGYYDVKLPASHVKGGEIGDSDRSLPWP
ncbi:hypothetical protein Gpo141_00002295 [Globisporangium polare]